MIDLKKLTIKTAHEHLEKGDFTARELAESYLKVIEKKNAEINAYLEVFDDVLDQAHEIDKKIKSQKKVGKLVGIPLALKDNILIKGRRVGGASKILEGYYAPYDSTVATKLKQEGVIFLGRTNMDEFAMGGSTENSAYGVTKNPHDTMRVAGGSSGGSTAAVAMEGALAGLGSDTGGSVRQPASFCGLVGLKPTYGRVSRYGLMAMGSSLDQIGPIAKTVADTKILFEAISGQDPLDSTTIEESTYPKHKQKEHITVGIPTDFLEKGIDAGVLKNFNETIEGLKLKGVKVKEISLPNIGYSLPVYYIIMPAEVSSNMSRFDGVRFGLHEDGNDLLGDYLKTRGKGFGPEVRRRIILGTYVLSSGYYDAYYNKANNLRNIIAEDFKKVFTFEGIDAVLTPTTPTPAFKIGEKSKNPLEMYLADIFTVTANIVGIPALSVPSGFSNVEGKDLPLGMQVMANYGDEETLFALGEIIENVRK